MEDRYTPATPEDKCVFGLVLECYAYLVIVNHITPDGLLESRTIPYDDFLKSLDFLSEFATFGMRFCGMHGIFEMIPLVSEFAAQRLKEAPEIISAESRLAYETLESRIVNWRHGSDPFLSAQDALQLEALAETHRQALLIFLETALAGSIVSNPGTRAKIQNHLNILGSQILDNDLENSHYSVGLIWTLMIGGSCLENQDLRDYLSNRLRETGRGIWTPSRAAETLELLWAENDERAYGPYGLYFVMEKHGISFCVS